jgi:hypothetical protein
MFNDFCWKPPIHGQRHKMTIFFENLLNRNHTRFLIDKQCTTLILGSSNFKDAYSVAETEPPGAHHFGGSGAGTVTLCGTGWCSTWERWIKMTIHETIYCYSYSIFNYLNLFYLWFILIILGCSTIRSEPELHKIFTQSLSQRLKNAAPQNWITTRTICCYRRIEENQFCVAKQSGAYSCMTNFVILRQSLYWTSNEQQFCTCWYIVRTS